MREPVTGFTQSEHRAIERFLNARTIPLCYERDGRAFVQGTGTFFRLRGKLYLVTAAHILEGIEPALLGVPDRPSGNVSVWNLNDITIHHPRDTENFDIAVIELLNQNFHARVASSWHFIDESDVVEPEAGQDEYLLAGYPTETVEDKNGKLTPQPMLQLFTKRYQEPHNESEADHDLLLSYPKTARGIFGDERSTPRLQGVSGAAVYVRVKQTSAVWSPEQVFRPVGLQVRMKHGEFIRIKRWMLLWRLFELIEQAKS
jgi:hypothetical protein